MKESERASSSSPTIEDHLAEMGISLSGLSRERKRDFSFWVMNMDAECRLIRDRSSEKAKYHKESLAFERGQRASYEQTLRQPRGGDRPELRQYIKSCDKNINYHGIQLQDALDAERRHLETALQVARATLNWYEQRVHETAPGPTRSPLDEGEGGTPAWIVERYHSAIEDATLASKKLTYLEKRLASFDQESK